MSACESKIIEDENYLRLASGNLKILEALWKNWQQIVAQVSGNLINQRLGIFLADQGTIGVATRGCKVGGLLCEIRTNASKVAVINYSDNHKIIGKAIILRELQSYWLVKNRQLLMRWIWQHISSECVFLG